MAYPEIRLWPESATRLPDPPQPPRMQPQTDGSTLVEIVGEGAEVFVMETRAEGDETSLALIYIPSSMRRFLLKGA